VQPHIYLGEVQLARNEATVQPHIYIGEVQLARNEATVQPHIYTKYQNLILFILCQSWCKGIYTLEPVILI